MYYFKTGHNIASFYDPITRFYCKVGSVTECETMPSSEIFNRGFRAQNIRLLSEVELAEYLKGKKVEPKEGGTPEPPVAPEEGELPSAEYLGTLTKAEIIEYFDYFDEEDLKTLDGLKKADLIEKALAIAEDYQEIED